MQMDALALAGGVDWQNNFVEKYIYAQGTSDVPKVYHRHMAISLIAACLQNRVWLEFYKNSPLYPNLYTFLVGPSGVGKGRAISAGTALLDNTGLSGEIGVLGGSLTSAALIDFLASKKGEIPGTKTSRAYIVHPELASSIKWGEHADALVKRMTDLFTGDLANYSDGTRTNKFVEAGKPCLNWIAGSTRKWLVANLKADALAGGFMARGLFVEVMAAPKRTVFMPEYPADYDVVMNDLQRRLIDEILPLSGPMTLEPDALEYLRDWFMNRVRPKSEEAQASWMRHRELALKVAMVLCAASGGQKIILLGHLYQAIGLVEEAKGGEKDLWDFILSGGKLIDLDVIAQKISHAGELPHSELLRMVSGRGMNARRVGELVRILEQQGNVDTKYLKLKNLSGEERDKRVILYTWIGAKPSLSRSRKESEWD